MRIAVDVRHLRAMSGTGGARVLLSFMRAFSQCDKGTEIVPYNRLGLPMWTSNAAVKSLAAIWSDLVQKNTFLPIYARYRAIEALVYIVPPVSFMERRIPQLCYVHDVPDPSEEYDIASMVYNDLYVRHSCRIATRVLAVSLDAANQIIRTYGVSPEKVRVVYQCCDLDEIRVSLPFGGFPGRRGYILGIVSRLGWRKNPEAYLEVFKRLPAEVRRAYPLVLIGCIGAVEDLRPYTDEVTLEAIASDVVCLGRVPDQRLTSYLKGASALLFPSRHEGFGLPLLEAVAAGTPAVASDIAVFRELFEDVAYLYPVKDYAGMAGELLKIIDGKGSPAPDGYVQEWLKRFSYSSYVARMKEILEEVCT